MWGGWLALKGRIDLGVMVAFIFYVQRFFDPIRTISQQYTMLQRATTAAHRIFEVMDVPVEIQNKPSAIELGRIEPSIEFRDVTFGYKPGLPVLSKLNIRIEPRQVVALVGPTGSGKSSIASLTRRFYDVWDGQVLVGGHDVRDVDLDSLGRNVGMVLQEPFLFTGTVFENIRNASAASLDEVIAAARAVRAHDFIVRLPQGYDTLARPARPEPVHRRKTADQLRPRPGRRPADPDPGRGRRRASTVSSRRRSRKPCACSWPAAPAS